MAGICCSARWRPDSWSEGGCDDSANGADHRARRPELAADDLHAGAGGGAGRRVDRQDLSGRHPDPCSHPGLRSETDRRDGGACAGRPLDARPAGRFHPPDHRIHPFDDRLTCRRRQWHCAHGAHSAGRRRPENSTMTFSEAQIMAWLSPVLWPFLRVLALFSVAPVFSARQLPLRAKIGLALLVALCPQGVLTDQPVISVNGRGALGAVAQQVAVGLAIGFALRLVFTAVELAGEIIGLQMGLNFASFFDPVAHAQISAVTRFFDNLVLLLFIVGNGHLLVLMAVVESFDRFPVDGNFLQALGQMRLHTLGSAIFSSALWIALPMIALLLFVNLTLGIISRVAPQMNIYAVGFPVTLTAGLLGITATLPMLESPVLALMHQAVELFATQRRWAQADHRGCAPEPREILSPRRSALKLVGMDRFGAAPADRHAVGQRRPRCATEESVRQAPSQAAKPSERQCEHQCFSQFSTIKPG